MFRLLIIYINLFLLHFCFAQEKQDLILYFYNYSSVQKKYELDFKQKVKNISTLNSTLDSIKKIGYFTLSVDSIKLDKIYYSKGKMYKKIWVKNDTLFNKKTDWFTVQNLDSLITNINNNYANKGFPFTQITVVPLGYINGEASVRLKVKLLSFRKIDNIAVEGYGKISKGYIKHVLGIRRGDVYNEKKLKEISEQIVSSTLIEEVRSPQTLFNTDSTTVFLYLKKLQANKFDGILGFGNDEKNNFKLNGNVLLELNNNFNGMEQVRLHWLSTANKNTSLDLNIRVPYLFQSPMGNQTQFKLFKKDSTFVTTSLQQRIFYQISQHSNLGVNFSYESSNFVLNEEFNLENNYNDYNKTGIGLSYELLIPSNKKLLEGQSAIYLTGRRLKRKGEFLNIGNLNNSQYEVGIEGFKIFSIIPKNLIKLKIEGYGLFSKNDFYTENELYRIGGFGSLRGFNEESVLASSYGIASLEYRFMPSNDFYVALFTDYATLENKSTFKNENLIGIGTGLSFLSNLGIFNISYAVGKFSSSPFEFKNSKIHFGILTKF